MCIQESTLHCAIQTKKLILANGRNRHWNQELLLKSSNFKYKYRSRCIRIPTLRCNLGIFFSEHCKYVYMQYIDRTVRITAMIFFDSERTTNIHIRGIIGRGHCAGYTVLVDELVKVRSGAPQHFKNNLCIFRWIVGLLGQYHEFFKNSRRYRKSRCNTMVHYQRQWQ